MKTRRLYQVITLIAVLAGLGACQSSSAPELPEYVEVPPGPRAPDDALFEVRVGRSSAREVRGLIAARGVRCEDLSPSTLGAKMAKSRRQQAKTKGKDATTRASEHKGQRRANPQLRLSCPKVSGRDLPDRTRTDATGRWLFVFDSPDQPLRHVSWRRRHSDHAQARDDLHDTVTEITKVYGKPTSEGLVPELSDPFKLLTPYKWEWKFSDIRVEVSALNYGSRGVDVLEAKEVPWPVRPDAPATPIVGSSLPTPTSTR